MIDAKDGFMKDGAKIVRPMIIFVLILLLIKVLTNLL